MPAYQYVTKWLQCKDWIYDKILYAFMLYLTLACIYGDTETSKLKIAVEENQI